MLSIERTEEDVKTCSLTLDTTAWQNAQGHQAAYEREVKQLVANFKQNAKQKRDQQQQQVDSSFLDSWAACLRDLQRLTVSQPGDSMLLEARAERVHSHITRIEKKLSVSVQTHAELVQHQQLPLQLFTACRDAAQLQLAPADKACVATAAVSALAQFLTSFASCRQLISPAFEERCPDSGKDIVDSITGGLPAAEARDWFSRIWADAEGQLQQSELQLYLPVLLRDCAAALRNHTAAAPAAAPAAAAAGGNAARRQKTPAVGAFTELLRQAKVLLDFSRTFTSAYSQCGTEPLPALKAAAPCTPAILELALASISSISSMLRQTGQPGESAGHAMQGLIRSVWGYVVDLAEQVAKNKSGLTGDPHTQPELLSVARSPHYQACLMLGMASAFYAVLAKQQPAAAQATSGSSSSRRARQQQRAQSQVQQIWEAGLQLQQHVTLPQQQLFDALGVSSTGLLFAAATLAQPPGPSQSETVQLKHRAALQAAYIEAHMADLVEDTSAAIADSSKDSSSCDSGDGSGSGDSSGGNAGSSIGGSNGSSGSGDREGNINVDGSSSSSESVAALQAACLHLLLPSLLLHTAAAVPTDSQDYLAVCVQAAAVTQAALKRWQQLTSGRADALGTAAAAAGAVQAVHELLLNVLPAVLSMLTHMLQYLHKDIPGMASSSSSSSDSNGSSGNSSQVPAGTNAPGRGYREAVAAVVAVLCRLLQASLPPSVAPADNSAQPPAAFDSAAAAAAAAAAVGGTSRSDAQLLAALQAQGWLGTILRRLEGFVRLTAAAPAWLSPVQDTGSSMDKLQDTFASLEAVCRLLDGHSCSFVQFVCSAGVGSAEVQQLQGLLVSLLKTGQACAAASPVGEPKKGFHMAAGMARDAAVACAGALMSSFAATTSSNSTSAAAAGATTTAAAAAAAAGGGCAAATATAAAAAAAAGGGNAIRLLPSLVVAGRWCLLVAERMRAQEPASIAATFRLKATEALRFEMQEMFARQSGQNIPVEPLGKVPEACLAFLQGGDTSAQLAAAGYNPKQLQQAASGLLQALRTVEAYGSGSEGVDGGVAATAMVQQLQALGHALTAVAIPHACNNPSCGNVSELREQKVVSGSGRTCSNCRVARYCSKECSAQHWPQHKPVCNAVKKAAARAGKAAETCSVLH